MMRQRQCLVGWRHMMGLSSWIFRPNFLERSPPPTTHSNRAVWRRLPVQGITCGVCGNFVVQTCKRLSTLWIFPDVALLVLGINVALQFYPLEVDIHFMYTFFLYLLSLGPIWRWLDNFYWVDPATYSAGWLHDPFSPHLLLYLFN